MPWPCFHCGSDQHDCGHREIPLIQHRRDVLVKRFRESLPALVKKNRRPRITLTQQAEWAGMQLKPFLQLMEREIDAR